MATPRIPYYEGGRDQDNPAALSEDSGRRAWWREKDEDKAARGLVSTYRAIYDDQQPYQDACERHYRMFRNMSVLGVVARAVFQPALQRLSAAFGIPASLNVVRPTVNTVVSMVSQDQPRAFWDTYEASRKIRRQAKQLEKVGDGLMYWLDGHERAEEKALQACIFGTGFTKEFILNGEPQIDPVFTPEIVVDQTEGFYRRPRRLYRGMLIDRDQLIDTYPKRAKDIAKLRSSEADDHRIWWLPSENKNSNMLLVVEGVSLPLSDGSGGRCCVAVGNVFLEGDEYKFKHHMYNELRWTLAPSGYQGVGIAEELIGIQIEINRLVRKIQAAIALLSNAMILSDANGMVNFDHLKDFAGIHVRWSGQHPPQVVVPQTVHQEVFNFLNMMYMKAWEVVGMNQMMATGNVPKRFSSGRAQTINLNIGNSRYAKFTRDYERSVRRQYQRLVELAKASNYSTRIYDRRKGGLLDWKDIDVGLDKFMLRAWDTDVLGNSPQEKQDGIDWMRANGLLTDRATTLDLVNSPDLDKFVRRETSGQRFIEEEIEDMLDGGEFRAPPSEVDLDDEIPRVQAMLLEAYYDKVEPKDIKKVQDWILTAKRMQQNRQMRQQFQQKIAQAQVPAAAGGAPPDLGACAPALGAPPPEIGPEEPLIPSAPTAPMLQ